MSKSNNFVDLSNTKIDNILVLECSNQKTKWGSYIWKCQCLLCGNCFTRESGNLHWARKQNKKTACRKCSHRSAAINNGKTSADDRRIGNASILLEDNPISYYLAGVIAADGCVRLYKSGGRNHYCMTIKLSNKDIEWNKKLAKIFNARLHYTKTVDKIIKGHKASGGEFNTFSVSDYDIVPKFAKKFDFKKAKTYNPPNIANYKAWTEEQKLSFLVGFIDGDGSVTNRQSIRINNHISWCDVQKYLAGIIPNEGKVYYFKSAPNVSTLILSKDARKILIKHIKKHKLPVLKRKWL